MTEDTRLLDHLQGLYQHLWSGGECRGCGLRDRCPGPLDLLEGAGEARPLTISSPGETPIQPSGTEPRRRPASKRRKKVRRSTSRSSATD